MEASSGAPANCKYLAFISYSHKDEYWARRLHRSIEGYRVPKPLVGRPGRRGPVPRQIFPVFRDRDELASSADLPAALREALSQSAHLIVLCSPAAAQSRWVDQEIIEFKRLGRDDRILPLVVDGEPHARAPERECFPPALRFKVDAAGRLTDQPAEPVAADLRPEVDGEENAKLKLIAGVLGVPFNDLRQRELVAARRRTRVRQGIGAALLLLAVLAAAGGWKAWRSGQLAEGLLAGGIRIAADQADAAVRYADQIGVPREMVGGLLTGAESAFDELYRQTVEPPAPLRGKYAMLLLVFADHYGVIGEIERQRATAEQARTLLGGVIDEEPANAEWRSQLALSEDLVADAHATKWRVEEALSGYRAALAIRQELAARDPQNTRLQREIGLSNTNIGDMLRRQGKWEPALGAHLATARLVPQLRPYCGELNLGNELSVPASDRQLERDLLIGNQRVGDMLLKQSAHEAAEASYGAAVAIAERLVDAEPANVQLRRDLAVSRSLLGNALQRQGKSEEALDHFKSSLETSQELAEEDPDNVGLQRDVFKSHETIGSLRFERGDLDEAKSNFEASIKIAEPLSAADPENKLLGRELSVLRNRLGEVLEAQGQPHQLNAALVEYRKALEARVTLAEADPTNAQAQRDLSLSHERVGDILRKQGRWQEAREAYDGSLAIAQRLAANEPANREWQREWAIAHHNVGRVLDAQGRADAAQEAYEAALAIVERLVADEPSDVEAQRSLLARYSNLGEFQERNGSRAGAQRSYCHAKAVILVLTDLEPDSGEWRERRTWVEERLRATQDGGPAPC